MIFSRIYFKHIILYNQHYDPISWRAFFVLIS